MSSQMWLDIILVWLGGGFGALTRFGVEHLHIFDDDKYYYTVGINLTGCLTIGILWALFIHFNVPRIWYLFLITGFLGDIQPTRRLLLMRCSSFRTGDG